MGLDTVELVMNVEDSFGIQIPDAEAERICTVGQLYDYVLHKLDGRTTARCLTARAFYRLRAALLTISTADRRAIRPASPLREILPVRRRRAQWDQLHKALGLQMPRLYRPDWVIASVTLCVLLGALLAVALKNGWFVLPLTAILAAGFIIVGTRPLAVTSRGCNSVGDLAKAILYRNYETFRAECGINRGEVWQRLVQTIASDTGKPESLITGDTRFWEDLSS